MAQLTKSSMALERLTAERKAWRKSHPFGFTAKPVTKPDGTLNLFEWECIVPGKKKTSWEGGLFKAIMTFPTDYPFNPPKVRFTPSLFHPNIYPAGVVCLSLLDPEKDWRAQIMIPQILIGLQELLDAPNLASPANSKASQLYTADRKAYEKEVKLQTKKMTPPE